MAERILVVDGNSEDRAQLASLMERVGYAAVATSSGEEAIERCREESFDLILLDLNLPGMDGWEVIKRLRKDWKSSGSREIPFVGLSEEVEREDVIRAYASGVSYYTRKRVRGEEILSGVRLALRFDGGNAGVGLPATSYSGRSLRRSA